MIDSKKIREKREKVFEDKIEKYLIKRGILKFNKDKPIEDNIENKKKLLAIQHKKKLMLEKLAKIESMSRPSNIGNVDIEELLIE